MSEMTDKRQRQMERHIQGKTVVHADLHPNYLQIHFDDGSTLVIEPEDGPAHVEIETPDGPLPDEP